MKQVRSAGFMTAACAAALMCSACADRDATQPASTVKQWRVERELQTSLAHKRDLNLPEVADLALGPDTVLYSLHPREQLVRVFNGRGALIHTIGRDSTAPNGETTPSAGDTIRFAAPTHFGLFGASLWIYDAIKNRVSFFDANGVLQQSLEAPAQLAAQGGSARFETLLTDGTLLVRAVHTADTSASAETVASVLLRLRAAPATPDTLLVLHEPVRTLLIKNPDAQQAAPIERIQPFTEAAYIALSRNDGMIVIVEPPKPTDQEPALHLTKINLVGDTLFSKPIPYTPVRLTRKRIQQEVDRINSELGASPDLSGVAARKRVRWIKDALHTPRNLPSATGLVIAADGTILLRREDAGADSVTWSVFSRIGELLAEQTTPATPHFMAAGGPFMFGAERDEQGVISLARYRVRAR